MVFVSCYECSRVGINSVMNLQHPGEHASCGYGLEEGSGFSYIPEDFMQADSKLCKLLNMYNVA